MKPSTGHRRPPRIALAAAFLALIGALLLVAQSDIDMTGYRAFHVKDGGVNYFQFQQTGTSITTVAPPDRGGIGRGGRGLAGTLQAAKLHLAPIPAPTAGRGSAPGRRARRIWILKTGCSSRSGSSFQGSAAGSRSKRQV